MRSFYYYFFCLLVQYALALQTNVLFFFVFVLVTAWFHPTCWSLRACFRVRIRAFVDDSNALVEDASSLTVGLNANKLDKTITFHDYESDRLETLLVSARCTSRVTSF